MNSQRFVSIRIKLLSLLFICILVPFLVYWFFSYEYIKTSLDEEFVSQTTDTMHATGNSISDYVKLVDYTARGLYFNSLYPATACFRRNRGSLIFCRRSIPVCRTPRRFSFPHLT